MSKPYKIKEEGLLQGPPDDPGLKYGEPEDPGPPPVEPKPYPVPISFPKANRYQKRNSKRTQ